MFGNSKKKEVIQLGKKKLFVWQTLSHGQKVCVIRPHPRQICGYFLI